MRVADFKHEQEGCDAFCTRQPRKRAVLTHHQASTIFEMRGSVYNEAKCSRVTACTARSVMVSRIFGVSSKTVRDIWNKRTWRHCTQTLWTKVDLDLQHVQYTKSLENGAVHSPLSTARPTQVATIAPRRVGRPRGSKDTKPRKPRSPTIFRATVEDKQPDDKQPAFFASSRRDGVLCGEDTAMFDPDTSQTTPAFESCKSMVQEEVDWESRISGIQVTPNASSAGFELDEEADLRRSFPFFLDV